MDKHVWMTSRSSLGSPEWLLPARDSKDAPATVHAFFPNLDLRHMQNNSYV
jgi:hypothetical protein